MTLSGGKQVVAIGGYEYDRNPINIYYASMFWRNIACYQFGVSATYHITPSQSILAQVCNSPYQTIGKSCYAYNLMWMGKMGHYETIWSTNLMGMGTRLDLLTATHQKQRRQFDLSQIGAFAFG